MQPGDRVRVDRGEQRFEGVVLPSSTPETIVVKLESGYNVGVERSAATVDVLESGVHDVEAAQAESTDDETTSSVEFDPDLPTVSLITTGGTIASTVDYRTGAVTARFDAEDVLRAVPELAGLANYRGRVVANILSENMTPDVWQELATAVHEEIAAGADGVVVMHGTDTMQFSASALAFMLETPVPVVFTGSQRSADRPSSDNVVNAVCAVEAATADCAEVLVCMHETTDDDRCALHRATRVRKNHTSRRDAFETVGNRPLGVVDYDDRSVSFRRPYDERPDPVGASGADDGDRAATDGGRTKTDGGRAGSDGGQAGTGGGPGLSLAPDLETDVALVKFTPGDGPERLAAHDDAAGVVLEGTGLGHVPTDWIDQIEGLTDAGTPVVMTSQCLEGRVCDRVYDTGRDLLDAGVVEAGDTLPGTAKVKLMWALANVDDPEDAMKRSLAGERTDRSVPWT